MQGEFYNTICLPLVQTNG